MNAYRRQQRLVAAFLLLCVVAGVVGSPTARGEIFPLYSWFLFSLVPTRTVAFDVLLREAPGHVFDPPVSYRQVSADLVRSPHSIVVYRAVQDLGRAVAAGDAATATRLRRVVEGRFNASPVRYDLVKAISNDPLEHWKTGRPGSSELLRSFVSEAPARGTSP